MGGEVRAGRRERGYTRRQRLHARGLTRGLGAKGTRGAHIEHLVHVRDAGGVEAQRLVEGRRALPSRREGMRCGGERCEPGGGRAWGAWWRHDKRHAGGKGPTQGLGGKGTRGAHREHVAHVLDTGGVKAQRLVEGRRVLPSRREGMRCGGGRGMEPGGGRACGVVAARQEACALGWPNSRLGGQGHARSARRTWRTCS